MNKTERRDFFRYLNSASDLELEQKLIKIQALQFQLREESTQAEAEWMYGCIIEELNARRNVK